MQPAGALKIGLDRFGGCRMNEQLTEASDTADIAMISLTADSVMRRANFSFSGEWNGAVCTLAVEIAIEPGETRQAVAKRVATFLRNAADIL